MNLFRSTFVVSFFTLFSRILGLVRDIILMGVFGANSAMDAFLVAFKIPNFLRRLFAEGAFSQAFVPVLTEYKETKDLTTVKILISHVAGTFGLILLVLTVMVMALSPVVINIFAVGFDEQKSNLASDLLRILFPYLFFIAMTAFFSSILQSYQRFALPAFTPVLLNISMIIGSLWVAPLLTTPIMGLAYAVTVAGLLQMLILLPSLYQLNLLARPTVNFANDGVKRILKLMLPALFGVSVTQINVLLNTILASMLITGSVSWLYTAERLSELPLGLIGVAIGTVILPNLAKLHTQDNNQHFQKTLAWATRLVFIIGVPASIALFLLADTLMITLFERGEFSRHDALMSGFALECMAGGILGFMLIKIFAPAFFARHDSKTPVKIGVISVIANVLFSLIFIQMFAYFQLPLHGGLALATTGASFVNAGLLYYQLHQQNIWKFDKSWLKFFLQLTFATFIMSGFLSMILPYFPLSVSQWWQILILVGVCLSGALVYAVALLLVGFRPKQLLL